MQYDVQQRAHQQKKENKLRDHSPFQGPNSFKAITPGSAITTSAITRWQNLLTELRTTPTPFRSSQRADKQATHSAHLPQFVAWESREVRKSWSEMQHCYSHPNAFSSLNLCWNTYSLVTVLYQCSFSFAPWRTTLPQKEQDISNTN